MPSKKVKTRNYLTWSESDFNSFIKGLLRNGTIRWLPRLKCIASAKVSYGRYKCSNCGEVGPKTLPPLPGRKRRRVFITADHINPIVDPYTGCLLPNGKIDWTSIIERMFVEIEGFQALCIKCHIEKSKQENKIAANRIKNNEG